MELWATSAPAQNTFYSPKLCYLYLYLYFFSMLCVADYKTKQHKKNHIFPSLKSASSDCLFSLTNEKMCIFGAYVDLLLLLFQL